MTRYILLNEENNSILGAFEAKTEREARERAENQVKKQTAAVKYSLWANIGVVESKLETTWNDAQKPQPQNR